MKKILFVFLLLGLGFGIKGQQAVANYSFTTLTGPTTLTITYANNIEGLTLEVLSSSTDSLDIYGNALTIGDVTFSHVTIGPGEQPWTMGYAGRAINYLYLNVQSGCVVRVGIAKQAKR